MTKSYPEGRGRREVLRGVSLEVPAGTLAVLLGKSGSGKSTLLNLISGIDTPESGEIELDGVRLDRLSERERTLVRRRRIGFIFQFYNLVPTLTVEENVRFLLDLGRMPREEARRRATSLLEEVGLADRAGAFPDTLSGGEQQRVAIARALAHDPALILADEPTGDLDADTGERILDLLERLARDHGRTLIVVTHDPAPISRADAVFELHLGRLVAEPTA
ncbi:ABC transporter ATP-binding protein [soil metagenome]